jgi:hypothetical protein
MEERELLDGLKVTGMSSVSPPIRLGAPSRVGEGEGPPVRIVFDAASARVARHSGHRRKATLGGLGDFLATPKVSEGLTQAFRAVEQHGRVRL